MTHSVMTLVVTLALCGCVPPFGTIEVRDFAVLQIASILGLGERPTDHWTGEDWARLRAGVREALT